MSIRPEEFILSSQKKDNAIEAKVKSSVFLGLNTHYFLNTLDDEPVEVIQESLIDSIIPDGAPVWLEVKKEKINIFSADGENNLLEGVRNDLETQ